MKYLLLLALFLTVRTASAQPTAQEKEIQGVVTHFFDALAKFDEAGMQAELSPGFTLLEDGLVWNLDSLVRAIQPRNQPSFSRINHFDFLRTEQKGEAAWVYYRNAADFRFNGKTGQIKWLESAVLIRQDKRWKLHVLHSTPLPPPKPKENK
jgi:hypothetical protein